MINTVQDLEKFFNKEFSAQELTNAIENSNVNFDELKDKFNIRSDDPKIIIIGNIAKDCIRNNFNVNPDNKFFVNNQDKNIEIENNAMKLGIEVAKGKFKNVSEIDYYKAAFELTNEKRVLDYDKNASLEYSSKIGFAQYSPSKDEIIKNISSQIRKELNNKNEKINSKNVLQATSNILKSLSAKEKEMFYNILKKENCINPEKTAQYLKKIVSQNTQGQNHKKSIEHSMEM